jgi:endoribonuclease Dicer
VAEAIIGAAFQTAGPDLALRVVKSLHLPLPFIESWEDFSLKAKVPPADITLTLDDNVLETVEVIVGARFQRPHILAQALVSIMQRTNPLTEIAQTHTSVRGNEMICYERLEFLGDAILDFCGCPATTRFPH